MFDDVLNRITTSWEKSHASLEARLYAGTEPEIVMVGTSMQDLIFSNSFYLFVIMVLFAYMKSIEKDYKEELKYVIAAYNVICVILAGYVVYGIVEFQLTTGELQFVCNDGARTGYIAERLGWIFWVFFAQKFWEFLDTWFFILRRNFNQVSVLHVYHHASITVVVGLLMRHQYTGDVYLPILLNAFIHVLMYSHYFVTSMKLVKKAWWSPILTAMQLTQFVLIATQSAIGWYRGPECGTPDWGKAMLIGYMGTMLILFGEFFVKKYIKGAAKKSDVKEDAKKTE